MSAIEMALREIAAASSAAADRIDAAEADGRAALAGIAERIDALLHPTVSFAGTGEDIAASAPWAKENSGLWYVNDDGAGWAIGASAWGNVAPPVADGDDAVFGVYQDASGVMRGAIAQFQHFFTADFACEVEATVPEVPPGIVLAPLWLYDPASPQDPEFDHEVLHNRLEMTLHRKSAGPPLVKMASAKGRVRFGIRRRGATVDWLLDGDVVWSATGDARKVKPAINAWAAKGLTNWAGDPVIPPVAPVEMRVHSWAFSGAA